HPAPCDGICERRHPRERRRSGDRLHAASPRHSEGRDGEPVSDGSAFDSQGHHGRGDVPDRRRDGHGSYPIRRWRRSFRPVVIEWSLVTTEDEIAAWSEDTHPTRPAFVAFRKAAKERLPGRAPPLQIESRPVLAKNSRTKSVAA